MKLIKSLFVVALSVFALNAMADELDPVSTLPQGVIVRENAQGVKEAFRANMDKVSNDASAAFAVKTFVKSENKVEKIVDGNELDKVTSNEAWCSWYAPSSYSSYYSPYYSPYYSSSPYYYSYSSYYAPSYSWNTYYYYPSYSYNYGGYQYSYYHTDYSCHHYSRGRWY